jgi:hypothetical protein
MIESVYTLFVLILLVLWALLIGLCKILPTSNLDG